MKASILADTTPRENAGSKALKGYDFQIHVSMARLLDIHAKGNAYAAFFDQFDDLVLIEGPDFNAEISFYQVKSRTGSPWTPSRLAERPSKGDLPRSIIGKSYYNIAQFGPLIRRASIVSNQPLKATYATGKKTSIDDGEILLSELSSKDHSVLVGALALDFSGPLDSAHSQLMTFERVPFDTHSYRDTVAGLVLKFVEAIGSGSAVIAKPFYDALLSEIGRCTGDTMKPRSFDDLKKRKSLDREGVETLITRAQQRTQTILEWWPAVEAELDKANVGAVGIQRKRNRCLDYWRARERGSKEATSLSNDIRDAISANPNLVLDKVLPSAAGLIEALPGENIELFDLEAAMIVEIMESQT